MQFHGGVYRSDDAGESWTDIGDGLPSDFGFPLVVDPADPDSAYVIPLKADMDRVTPEGHVRVYETRDAGATLDAARRRAAGRARVPDRPARGVRPHRRGRRRSSCTSARRPATCSARRRRRDVVLSGDAPSAGLLGPRRVSARVAVRLTATAPTGAVGAEAAAVVPSALVAVDDHAQAPAEVARGRRRSAARSRRRCRATLRPDWRCHWYA